MRALILTLFLAIPAAAQDAATLVTAARQQVGVTVW